MAAEEFTFIDLFAGIGGLRLGFQRAGGQCVWTSEWNKFSQRTYQANFGDEPIWGDITKADPKEIPDHNLLLGGFPCQPFSIAGVSKKQSMGRAHGFDDRTQGTLFFDVARIIATKRPEAFVLENVKNLLSHDRGKTFEVIQKVLTEDLGYSLEWRIVDAAAWVPQHRERIFLVGFRGQTGFGFNDLSIPELGPKMKSILHPQDGSEVAEDPYTRGKLAKVADKYILSDKMWKYLQAYADKHRAAGNGFGYGMVGPDDVSRTLSARYYKDGSEILVSRGRGRPRRLTPRECARLQGFDRPGGSSWKIPVSDSQAYRQFGNAVAVPVIEQIAQIVKPHLLELVDSKISLPAHADSDAIRAQKKPTKQ